MPCCLFLGCEEPEMPTSRPVLPILGLGGWTVCCCCCQFEVSQAGFGGGSVRCVLVAHAILHRWGRR